MLTLVLGDSGKVGRRVIERLTKRGTPTRAAVRFDWEQPATWTGALRAVGAVYVSRPPDADAVRAFAHHAVGTGARRIVLLSPRGDAAALPAEQALRDSGADWTIVRASWFGQTFSEGCLLGPVRSGHVPLPAGPVGEPFVDADDVADVVVAALTDDRHAGRIYEATGPRLLTLAEAVEELAQATGRRIRYVRVSTERYAALLAEQQVPDEDVARLTRIFTELLDGRNARLTAGVERAIGREPRDFADYARHAASTGVWEKRT